MTVKNALEILDGYVRIKTQVKNGIRESSKPWNAEGDLAKKNCRYDI